jgi:hypothetical protein
MWPRRRDAFVDASGSLRRWLAASLLYRKARSVPPRTIVSLGVTPGVATAATAWRPAIHVHHHVHRMFNRIVNQVSAVSQQVVWVMAGRAHRWRLRRPALDSTTPLPVPAVVARRANESVVVSPFAGLRAAAAHAPAPWFEAAAPNVRRSLRVSPLRRAMRSPLSEPHRTDGGGSGSATLRLAVRRRIVRSMLPAIEPDVEMSTTVGRSPVHRRLLRRIVVITDDTPRAMPEQVVVARRVGVPKVWRQRRPVVETVVNAADPSPDPTSGVVARREIGVDPSAGAAAPRGGRPQASPAFALDGPVIDRLAEDVMQRIERRLRIERERRGM